MCCEYRFAGDDGGQEMLKRFAAMLDAGETLEKEWPKGTGELLCSLDAQLTWMEGFGRGLPALKESFFESQLENVRFTLDAVRAAEDASPVPGVVRYQLPCFLRELREEIYFRAYVQPFEDRRRTYYDEEFADHHKNGYVDQGKIRYEVSIFVPAKDQLAYTRQCVESILRETDKAALSYELILINHGSRDDTQEYFESVPGAKLLHFKHNVRMMMFSSAVRVCEGRYMAFVSNDTIVTANWLKLLLNCIRSNPSVISVTPATSNISNFQSVAAPYANMEELTRFAEGFNRPDPSKWDRRARIMPVIALYDIEKLNAVGFADRYFSTMEFWDDDFSLRARRAGYAQILCRDVYCHHYGSVTGKEAQVKEDTLQKGWALFVSKHGVDPWQNGAYYDYPVCDRLQKMTPPQSRVAEILGVDCGFGDTLLQIGNILRKSGVTAQIDTVTLQMEYAEDLRAISRVFYPAEHEPALLEWLKLAAGGRQYDYTYLSRPLEAYSDWKTLLSLLCDGLKPGGLLLFCVSNALDSMNFQSFGALLFPAGRERICYLDPKRVSEYLSAMPLDITGERKRSGVNAAFLELLAKQAAGSPLNEGERVQTLDTAAFIYFARKKA
ncbi:MAG: glycosyltransferase [Bacillota bacterium]